MAILHGVFQTADSFRVPSEATLAGLSMPQRIVAIAESQIGYSTEPSNSYCNKFSAYWNAGTADCPSGEMRRGVVRRLRRLGLAEGRSALHLRLRPGRDQRRRRQLL